MTKTLTFAAMHFSIAFAVAYALTGDLVVGGAVALVEPMVNTLGYHVHERIWRRFERAGLAGGGAPERPSRPPSLAARKASPCLGSVAALG